MRIISGSAKGAKLFCLEGTTTRPTSDRAKEALFNILGNINQKSFLDLFSGSGSIALEASSRGASYVTAIEKNEKSYKIICKNLEKTKLNNVQLYLKNALDFLEQTNLKYDYIFLDPPYDSNLIIESIKIIIKKKILNNDGLIICEVDSNDDKIKKQLEDLEQIQIIDIRKYGRNTFIFLKIN